MIEPLESRQLLSGNVRASLVAGRLSVIGDGADNVVDIQSTSSGLTIAGLNDTTINGRASIAIDLPILSATISLRDGNDALRVRDVNFAAPVGIDGGEGDDVIDVRGAQVTAIDVFGSGGDDRVGLVELTASKRLRVFGGSGRDATGLQDVRARRGLDITDTGSRSRTVFARVDADGESWVSTSSGADRLEMTDSRFFAFSAKLKDGDDSAFIRGSKFNTYSPINGGAGTNDIDREVIFASDYGTMTDANGWKRMGSSEPLEFSTFADSVIARRRSVRFSLGTGAGMERALTVADGLMPNTTYTVKVELKYGTDVGMFIARVLAGAVPAAPQSEAYIGQENGEGVITINGVEYRTPPLSPLTSAGDQLSDSTGQGRSWRRVTAGTRPRVTTGADGKAWALYSIVGGSAPAFYVHYLTASFTFTPISV